MIKIPKFKLYGEDNPSIENDIQPHLELRGWNGLDTSEKAIAFQQLRNAGWIDKHSEQVLETIEYLNHAFLRRCPGKHLHKIKPEVESYGRGGIDNKHDRMAGALLDFQYIFVSEESEAMVFRMFTYFILCHINRTDYEWAKKEKNAKKRREYIESAFKNFDKLVNCLNHIFEQFFVNVVLTRNGLVPRQDEKITERIYVPTLKILADPKWKTISDDLAKMFIDYQEKKYSEAITKAHGVVQRFLQISVGEEGKNSKGEVGKLFKKAKNENFIPINRFTEPIITVFQKFISSERATNSTAKPTLRNATSSDALLLMNVIMIFLQHCLQKNK